MKSLSFKIVAISALALCGFGLVTMQPVSAQGNFTTTQSNVGLNVPGGTALQGDKLIATIQNFINRVLGMLAFIALIILLYGGFQMVTAAGDEEKYGAGFKILKQAGIGLAFIGLAWMVISLIMFLINFATT